MHFWSFVFVWFWERGVFLARCFISWVAPDMTTILKARDKRLKEQSEVGKTRLLGLATPSSRAVGLWWRAASGLRPRPRRRRPRAHGAQGPAHDGGDLGLPQVGTPGGGREPRHGRGAHRCLNRSERGRVGTGHWRHSWCSVGGAQTQALPLDCVRDCAQCLDRCYSRRTTRPCRRGKKPVYTWGPHGTARAAMAMAAMAAAIIQEIWQVVEESWGK